MYSVFPSEFNVSLTFSLVDGSLVAKTPYSQGAIPLPRCGSSGNGFGKVQCTLPTRQYLELSHAYDMSWIVQV